MIEQLTYATDNQTEALSQHEVDLRFHEMIIEMIELSNLLTTDLQADKLEELKVRRNELLAELMQNPTESFLHEFTVLEHLYEGRTRRETDSLGTTVSQFVTRDSSRQKADLHFKELHYPSGSIEQTVEVPRRDEVEALPFVISVKDGAMRIALTVYRRGMYQRLEIDPESEKGQQLLTEFFTNSIVASDLAYSRTPDEIEQANRQAVRFLAAKQIQQRTF